MQVAQEEESLTRTSKAYKIWNQNDSNEASNQKLQLCRIPQDDMLQMKLVLPTEIENRLGTQTWSLWRERRGRKRDATVITVLYICQLPYRVDYFELHTESLHHISLHATLYTRSHHRPTHTVIHTHHLEGASLSVISIQYSAEFWALASLSVQGEEEEGDNKIAH